MNAGAGKRSDIRGPALMRPIGLLLASLAPLVAQPQFAREVRELLEADNSIAHRDFEPRLIGGLAVNMQHANTVGGTLPDERAIPWVGGRIELGASVVHRDRIGLAITGGSDANGYLLWPVDSVCYDLYHITKRAELRGFWLLPPGDRGALRSIGIAAGYTFQNEGRLSRTQDNFQSETTAPAMVRPYLAPEVGFLRSEGKDRFELGLRYLVHLDRTPAWTNVSTSSGGDARYQATDDHIALTMRYHFGSKPRPRTPIPPPMVDHADRAVDTLTALVTRRTRITLSLWDNAEFDGDTISVFLNEVPVLSGHLLTKQPKKIRIDLRRHSNTILVVAHNEGRVPPNTASCVIRRGKGREELLIRTSAKNDQALVIRRE